ncbi:CBS domain-containing protein [Altererythrobacter sp. ZODW24]|uniref:CBS domain-containing protein n=1 Tax=Altererythrobacter sp. ZODW24 TaxID=2185142 RepID=UPI000DF72BB2|nr:CBS domain-containing protein [Altererythrobacter sp. ZODW24]
MEVSRLIEGRSSGDIITCEFGMKVRDVIALLAEKRIGALPVMQAGKVVGIFSERDVIYKLAAEGAICLDREISEVMTAEPITVAPSTKVDHALALMTRRRIRHLPVVEGDHMRGFISIGDLVKSRIDEVQSEAEAMRSYIQTS